MADATTDPAALTLAGDASYGTWVPDGRPLIDGLFVTDGGEPRLLIGRCPACDGQHFPAQPSCPSCGADRCSTHAAGPLGTLELYTAVHARPPGYRGDVPYGFGVVALDGGLCIVSRLTEHRLERLRPGLRVRLVVTPVATDDGGTPLLCWAFSPEEGS
jgi:uncharacterized OB-fold protein